MIPNQWYVILESREIKDKPVGVTRTSERPIRGDFPIIEYRRRRQELIEQSQEAVVAGG